MLIQIGCHQLDGKSLQEQRPQSWCGKDTTELTRSINGTNSKSRHGLESAEEREREIHLYSWQGLMPLPILFDSTRESHHQLDLFPWMHIEGSRSVIIVLLVLPSILTEKPSPITVLRITYKVQTRCPENGEVIQVIDYVSIYLILVRTNRWMVGQPNQLISPSFRLNISMAIIFDDYEYIALAVYWSLQYASR